MFLPNRIRELTVDGRRQRTSLRPIPEGVWYTTAQAQRKAASMIEQPSSDTPVLICRVFDPSLGENPVETKYFFEGRETISALDEPIECTVWRIKHADSPASREWLNAELQLVRARTELGGGLGEIEMRRATRAEAQAAGNAPEIMLSTVISPTMPSANCCVSNADTASRGIMRKSMTVRYRGREVPLMASFMPRAYPFRAA